jgi:hypothetical protein
MVLEQIPGEIKVTLEVSNGSLKSKYLGMPIDVGRSANWTFKYMSNIIWKNIQG